jgi:short-subunit dehydrogenase
MAELIRESLPLLKVGADPLIVNMNSVLGHRATPLKSEYCASKFAVHGLSDAIRAELAGDGVDLLLVSPSTTDSDFFDSAIEDETGKDWKKGGAMSPETVAAKTIRAMQKRRHEIILTFGGRIIVWLDRIIPGIANRLVARFGQ